MYKRWYVWIVERDMEDGKEGKLRGRVILKRNRYVGKEWCNRAI